MAGHVGKGNAERLSHITLALFDESVGGIFKDAYNLGVYLIEVLDGVS